MSRRFGPHRADLPAADLASPDAMVTPLSATTAGTAAVSPSVALAPTGPSAERPASPRLEHYGDVLTDADLAALCQRPASWPRRERDKAKVLGGRPNLPVRIEDGMRAWRYRAVDVAYWLRTGRSLSAPVGMSRVS